MEQKDVTPGSSPEAEQKIENATAPATVDDTGANVQTPPEAPGGKTPPDRLYAALQEERRLRQEAEDKLKTMSSAPAEPEIYSDEGKVLHQKITSLQDTIRSLQEEKELERLQAQNPVLRDKAEDFQRFKAAHPGYKSEDVAKLFIVEQGLSAEPARKGLERRTSGTKVPVADGYTAEEVANLRKTNFKKYTELITSGKVNFSDLK